MTIADIPARSVWGLPNCPGSSLILTGNRVPVITVVMAQFVTEMGLRWNLMAATAVLALVPAFLLALFGQKYVIRGLRI